MMSMAANMACNLIFIYPLGYVGLALSTACSGTLNAALLFKGLHQQNVYRPSRHTGVFCLAVDRKSADGRRAPLPLAGSGPMGRLAHEQGEHATDHAAGAGGAIYAGVLLALGIRPKDLRAGRDD